MTESLHARVPEHQIVRSRRPEDDVAADLEPTFGGNSLLEEVADELDEIVASGVGLGPSEEQVIVHGVEFDDVRCRDGQLDSVVLENVVDDADIVAVIVIDVRFGVPVLFDLADTSEITEEAEV